MFSLCIVSFTGAGYNALLSTCSDVGKLSLRRDLSADSGHLLLDGNPQCVPLGRILNFSVPGLYCL